MLIERIIVFEFRGFGLPDRTCTPTTGNFHDKTKPSQENCRVDYSLLLKYCRSQYILLPPTWTDSITKHQNARFECILTLNCK